jgi:hypothetical protein
LIDVFIKEAINLIDSLANNCPQRSDKLLLSDASIEDRSSCKDILVDPILTLPVGIEADVALVYFIKAYLIFF